MIELVLRIGFSLLVVLGLMWALARAVRRPLGASRGHGPCLIASRPGLALACCATSRTIAGRFSRSHGSSSAVRFAHGSRVAGTGR